MSRYLASAAFLGLLAVVACSPQKPAETPAASEATSEAAVVSSLPPADYTALANVMTCDWPVKKTDTAESLLATYKTYAQIGEVYDVSGPEKAVIIYGNDPRRRVVVLFHDDVMTEVKSVQISDDSQWSGPKGLHVGSTLADVVAANEKPFKLNWLDRYYFGYPDLKRGKLAHLRGGCHLDLRVAVSGKATPLPSDVLLPSSVLDEHIVDATNPELENVPLMVTVMSVSWPKAEAAVEDDADQ